MKPVLEQAGLQVEYRSNESRTNESVLHADSLARSDMMFIYNARKGSRTDNTPDLTKAQEDALYRWVEAGHGVVAVHSASSSYLQNPRYAELIGAADTEHGTWQCLRRHQHHQAEHPAMAGVSPPTGWDEGRVHRCLKQDLTILATANAEKTPWTWVRPQGKGWVQTLPPAKPPAFWYAYNGSTRFPSPAFNMGGRVACAGSRYNYDASLASSTRLPSVFDGMRFVWDWRQRWIRAASMDAQGTLTGFLDLFAAQIKREEISRLTDLKVGPAGALYALQYGWADYQPSTRGALFRFDCKRPECHAPATAARGPGVRQTAENGGPAWPARGLLPVPRPGGWEVFDIAGRKRRTF